MANKYDYKGTKITGTSTTAKVFEKSDVSNAKKNDKYFNTSTGHVYTCDTAGKPSKAKWKYTRTDIAKKPSLKVKKLGAPVRTTSGSNTHMMEASWKVPSDLTNEKKGDRAEKITIDWWLGIKGKDPKRVKDDVNTNTTTSKINLNKFVVGGKTYTRESFYPFKGKPKLKYVTVGVKPYNSKGNGSEVKETRNFTNPKEPSIDSMAFNPETGVVSTTVRTDAGTGYAERYDTYYKVSVYRSAQKKWIVSSEGHSTSTAISVSYNVGEYQSLGNSQYVLVKVSAYARGYAGPSKSVTRSFYVSYPARVTIKSAKSSSKGSAGKCTVAIKTNTTKEHPVDRVKLEYLADVEYATAGSIPAIDWSDSDIIDDSNCTALAIPVADIMPSQGKYTWVRVKSWHANENVLYRYSNYVRVKDLETPAATAADDNIVIVSATAGADGESAVVQLGWDRTGHDDSTGTELTWSDREDTWKSTDEPDSHEFDWEDTTASGQSIPVTYKGVTYRRSATITIKGLDEGVTYYVKARRYLDGDTTTYSKYSNTATVIPSERPESIVATADRYVPEDGSLMVRWTFSGNGLQRSWQIVRRVEKNGAMVDDAVIASGEGSIGATQISAERLSAFATDGELRFNVQASTGSGYVSSEDQIVTIIEPPTLEITGSSLVHVHEEDEQTYTGDIVQFDDPRGVLGVKSVLTSVEPIQSGSGTPSPDNVRPISGHTECVTYVSPTTSETDAEVYTTDLGRTVYGGTLDVVSGVLTDSGAMFAPIAVGSIVHHSSGIYFCTIALPNPSLSDNSGYIVSDMFKKGALADGEGTCYITGNGATLVIILPQDITTKADANAWLVANAPNFCYELSTPQTYQLTPQEVELLLGTNNLWTDCGETEVKTVEVLVDEDQLQTNDLSITCKSNQLCDLITIVTSQGASGQFPQGVLRQTVGDTIHSDVYEAEWTEANDEFTTTLNLPTGLDFWDGGRYTATITAVDRQTGLKSNEATLEVPVVWIHQAMAPFDAVTLTPLNYTDDENDMHHQAVQINLTPPTGSVETDLYDIYRMTGDGAKLIGQSYPLTSTATDEYAPFGDDITCYYRIALRTADGDVEFSDIEYNLDGNAMRFDWSGGTLELPYNLSIADSYKKDVDIRKHMDGSVDGYWNQNIERKGSLNSDAIRLAQQDDINAARRLARYPGAVFVRTPDGSAYEADVQVSDLSTEGVMTAIAIDAQEIGLTQEFVLPTPYPLEEESE